MSPACLEVCGNGNLNRPDCCFRYVRSRSSSTGHCIWWTGATTHIKKENKLQKTLVFMLSTMINYQRQSPAHDVQCCTAYNAVRGIRNGV